MTDAALPEDTLPAQSEAGGGPRSALRALDALKKLAVSPEGLTLAELAKTMQVPKSSLHELLRALHHGGYIVNNRGQYQLGNGAITLANLLAGRDTLIAVAHPHLEALSVACDETSALVELNDERHIVYRDFVQSRHPLQFRMATGQMAPIHCSSGGLAILAMRPEEERAAFIAAGGCERYTEDTICTAEELEAAFAEIRATGIATTRNSMFEGVLAIASPVFDADGWPCAAIGVIGPSVRLAPNERRIRMAVRNAAERLSRDLGARTAYPGGNGPGA